MNWDRLFSFFFGGQKSGSAKPSQKILIVDDGEVERKYISRALEKGGYQVVTAENGEMGLKLAMEEKPDLVLLDFIMPGIHGDAVCKRLKMDEKTKRIPVVFLTGSVKPASVIQSYESGAEYYLSKPIGSKELLKQVEMILSEQSLPANG